MMDIDEIERKVGAGELSADQVFTQMRQHINSAKSDALLREALRLLEHATYHDGRYEQVRWDNFQIPAQKFVRKAADHLGLPIYSTINTEPR